MRLYDNHNHSQFSFDGRRASVETSVAAAMERGLQGMCFTDHCDFFVPPMKADFEKLVPEVFDVEAQQAEIDRVAAVRNTGDFKIYKGIEIGLCSSCREQIRTQLAEYDFDEVIASVHYLDDTDPFFGGYYVGKTWREAYGHYLETLCEEMIWLGDFDIMGHFDYVARYAPYPKESILYRDFPDLFDTILRYLAENGKALEINTKTYQTYTVRPYRAGVCIPPPGSAISQESADRADTESEPLISRTPELDPDILRRFKELGGEMISLGSDSHDPSRPGKAFDSFAALAKACGFKYLVHFSSRCPVFDPI